MRPHGEHKLENQLVRRQPFAVPRAPELSAHLAEFAGPISEDERSARVLEQAVEGKLRNAARRSLRICRKTIAALRTVESSAEEPAPAELVIAGHVKAERSGCGLDNIRLSLAEAAGELRDARPRPDELAPPDERMVDRAPQRLPSQREIGAEQLIAAVPERAVSARV